MLNRVAIVHNLHLIADQPSPTVSISPPDSYLNRTRLSRRSTALSWRSTSSSASFDVEAILVAWHERQIALHLRQLTAARDAAGTPAEQLEAVLTAFALIQHEHHGTELPVSLLHRGEHVAEARQQLKDLVADLLATGAQKGEIRDDMAPGELASFCLHALTAAGNLPSEAAVRRLVAVTLAGLRPPR